MWTSLEKQANDITSNHKRRKTNNCRYDKFSVSIVEKDIEILPSCQILKVLASSVWNKYFMCIFVFCY